MAKVAFGGRWWAAATVVVLSALLAACAPGTRAPAPVVYGNARPAVSPAMRGPAAASVIVAPGQSLSMIAAANHVAWPALAAANNLAPPYRVEPGQRLILPTPGAYAAAPPSSARVAVAELPPARPIATVRPPRVISPAPLPRRKIAAALPPRPVRRPPLQRPLPPHRAAAAPRVIPLDHPMKLAEAEPRPATRAPHSLDRPIPLDNPAAASRAKPAGHAAGSFVWPVRGRILEGFGRAPNGTHNQGINIAAPPGTPIRAAGGGVVAYVGNELRGYGNLILIRHPEGWISAYAHCGAVLVKRGERVRRGQVIARIGATGNVRQPQLHFELRHGRQAVDPRPLLGGSRRAATRARERAG